MYASLRRLTLIFFCCVLLSACGPMSSIKIGERGTSFQQATDTFRKLIRWGAYEDAAKYLRGQTEQLEEPDLTNFAHYKITAYDVGEPLLNYKGDEARVVALIEYYDIDTGVASSRRDEQYWWFDYTTQHWFLGSPFLKLGPTKK
jgi:hypothetical protein